jgi:hypothetical protein
VAHRIDSTEPTADGRGEGLGAPNLSAKREAAFDDASAVLVADFASHAAFVLVNAQVCRDPQQLNESLNQAVQSHATIDYAVGIFMAHGGHSPRRPSWCWCGLRSGRTGSRTTPGLPRRGRPHRGRRTGAAAPGPRHERVHSFGDHSSGIRNDRGVGKGCMQWT